MSHTQLIGPYTAGEIPESLVHRFLAHSRAPVDLQSYSAKLIWERVGATPVSQERDASVTDASNGEVTYNWVASDLDTPGTYNAQIWVGDGATRLASTIFVYEVEDGPGTPPAI